MGRSSRGCISTCRFAEKSAISLKGVFYYHYYENYYTLAYIDKMWGIMRKEAFPEEISL